MMDIICKNDENVDLIHNKLNSIYSFAEDVFQSLKIIMGSQVSYGFYKGHYIKIGKRYEYQKYPIPVISVLGKGDIGVNINGVWFEFFLEKIAFNKADIENLLSVYRVEIYGGTNCLIDFYTGEKSVSQLMEDVNTSKEETIGIAVYLDDFQCDTVKDVFTDVWTLLNR
jgi:hypothetical protein